MKHIVCYLVLFCCALQALPAQTFDEEFDEYVKKGMAAFEVPGLAISIVKDGECILSRGYGLRAATGTEAVDGDTVFGIASISKSFTATALGMLVEEGKLRWDDPVRKYLPDFKMYDPYVTREITIRDLLTHRCGLGGIAGGTFWYGSDLSSTEIVRRMEYVKPAMGFRGWFAYQSLTFLAAGQLIPAVTGMSWFEFIKKRILKPMDMNRSSVSIDGILHAGNAAVPHARLGGRVSPVAYRDYDNMAPAVSINSSAGDMAHYMMMFLNGGIYNGEQLLTPGTVYELTTPQMLVPLPDLPPQLEETKPMFCSYGLGWFVQDYKKHKIIAHGGQIDGLFSLAILVPELSLGVAVMINQEEEGLLDAVTNRVMDVYIDKGKDVKDWIPIYVELKNMIEDWRQKKAVELYWRPAQPRPASWSFQKLAGTYHDEAVGDILIGLDRGSLTLAFPHTPSFSAQLEHWDKNNFKINWSDPYIPSGLLEFTQGTDNHVKGLSFKVPEMEDVDFSELNAVRK